VQVAVAVEFCDGSAAYVVTTFYSVVLSHNNNDNKLLKLQSKFDFKAFYFQFQCYKKQVFVVN